jgi:hemoglobin-like flavoprotein
METQQLTTFSGSLSRCLADPGFLTRFYELFVGSSPEVAEKFKHTDFDKQKRALSSSLYVMVMAMEGGAPALAYLERIAEQHGRNDLDIRPELYDSWLNCLIQAVREHDPQFTEELERLWRETMQVGIGFIRERY